MSKKAVRSVAGKTGVLLGLLALLTGLVNLPVARADVIDPNSKSIDYCFEVTNLEAFPGYVFLTLNGNLTQVLKAGSCPSFTRYAGPKLVALKESDYSPGQNYTADNPKVINSNFTFGIVPSKPAPPETSLQPMTTINKDSPVTKVVDVLKVVEVSDSGVKLQKASVRYTYTDGKTEELPYQNQTSRPAYRETPSIVPGVSTSDFNLWWAIVIPAVALVAIVALLLVRRGKRR